MMKPASRFAKAKRSYGSRAQRPLFFALGLFTVAAFAQTGSVLTYHYDNARTGQNTQETTLTPANVSGGGFGKLFSQSVDGQVYAQPLYVPNVNIPGKGAHNVVLVATEGDTVYAFDADSNAGANAAPLWTAKLIDAAHGAGAGETTVRSNDVLECNIIPQIGITGTPVIDPATGTLYVEAKSEATDANGHRSFFHRLHALDLTTGMEKSRWPINVTAVAGGVPFDSKTQLNRAGLLLSNGAVYVAYGSHCDAGDWHGWVMAYDAVTLNQKAVFITTPNAHLAGIWMSGAGLAADASGNLFIATSNGTFDTTLDARGYPAHMDFGDSIVKLSGSNLSVLDYFTPFDTATLDSCDEDLGSGGVLLLPDQFGGHPHLLVHAGKDGAVRLIDRDQMTTPDPQTGQPRHILPGGTYATGNVNIAQELPEANPTVNPATGGTLGVTRIGREPGHEFWDAMWSMPAYWNGTVYFWANANTLKAFRLSNGLLSRTPNFTSTDAYGFPGANMSISSNGTANGILWALKTDSTGDSGQPHAAAGLRAYDANNGSRLYSSDDNPSRDNPGIAVKFSVPSVVNGKVYVGAADRLSVFGLLPPDFSMSVTPASQTVTAGGSVNYTITVTPLYGFNSNVTLSVPASLPAGISVSFNPTVIPGGSGTSTMTVTTQPTTASASLTGPITGTGGGLTRSANATLVVAGFSLSVSPATGSVVPGGCTTYAVSVSDQYGFSGIVTLAPPSGLPAGATYSYSQNPINGTGSSTLTVCTPASTPLVNSPLTITGTSGALSQSAHVTLAVTDFSLSATPALLSTGRGIGANYTVTVAPLNAFTGPVTLSAPGGLPAGATYTYSVNPVTVGNGPASTTLTITPSVSGVFGNFPWTIGGTAIGATHSTGAALNVVSVTTQVDPLYALIPAGATSEYNNSFYAMDYNPATYASGSVPGWSGENYGGFSNVSPSPVAMNLKVTSMASIADTSTGYISAYYSLNNGMTWSTIYFLYGPVSRGLQTDVIPLPTSQNLQNVMVQFDCVDDTGFNQHQVYEVTVEVTH